MNPNPTEKREPSTPTVESWIEEFDEKFCTDSETNYTDKEGNTLMTKIFWGEHTTPVNVKQFISSQIQQAEEKVVERIREECAFASQARISTEFSKGYREAIDDILASLKEKN